MQNPTSIPVPELTLDGMIPAFTPAEAALTEAHIIRPATPVEDVSAILQAKKPDTSSLNPQELAAVSNFMKQIDLSNTTQILQYGNAAQAKISRFSETALENIRTKDMDSVGKMISDLVLELKGFSPEQPKKKGLAGVFQKGSNQLVQIKTQYDSVEKNINKICASLEQHKIVLLKDIAVLDEMFQMNLAYFKELTMYIFAGRERLEQIITQDLPALQTKAQQSGSTEDAQAARHLADMCNRFDKKLHDLDLTRTVCLQMGPQIRLVQNNDSIMVEKIQSSLVNTIPLWKNQMVLALGLAHSKSALEAQKEVTDMTNKLLLQNAETLKIGTIEVAQEAERGVVDVETLVQTNESLITTLDEVMCIQADGKQKRRAAEQELARIEGDLKVKLLEIQETAPQ